MEHFFLLLAAEEALLARLEMPLELVGPAHQCGYLGVDDTEISIKSKANFSSLRGIFIATAQFRVIFIAKAKILPPPSVRAYLSVSGRSRGALTVPQAYLRGGGRDSPTSGRWSGTVVRCPHGSYARFN